jgi:hypothetical protein
MDLLAAKSCGGAETQRTGDRDRGRIKGQAVTRQGLFRVKLRRTQCEQMSSGLSLKADIAQYSRHFAFVPATEIDDANRIDEAQKTAPFESGYPTTG